MASNEQRPWYCGMEIGWDEMLAWSEMLGPRVGQPERAAEPHYFHINLDYHFSPHIIKDWIVTEILGEAAVYWIAWS